jgi:PASTA domain-containing protein/Big-like domain-containing protein
MRHRYHTTRARARHRWARGAFLRLEVLVVLIVAVCLGVLSASQRPERIHIQLTGGGGGSLTLSNTKEGAAILTLAGMRPGETVMDTVTLGNTGTVPGDLSLSTSNVVDAPGAGGGALSGELDLRIRDTTNAGSPVTVYTGKIDALTPVALGTIAAGDSRVYEFRVSFPDAGAGAENAYQGSGLSVEFDWTAIGSDADVDPPETTITSAPGALSATADPSFSFTSDEAGGTFECSLDGGSFAACSSPAAYSSLADGGHTFAVRATDTSANTDATPDSHSWTIDATAPNVALIDPGVYLRGTVALEASADDGTGSGLASLTIQRSPVGGGAWTAIAANWNTTGVAEGDYQLRALATDNAGNIATSPIRDVTVDNTAPSVSYSTPLDGAVVGSAGALTITASEDLSGIANAKIDGVDAPAPVISGPSVTYTAVFDDTPHTFSGDLTDLAGNTRTILVHFTVWALAAADYPWVEANSFAGAATTLEAADGVGDVFVPAGAWSGAPAGDWLVINIDPRPPVSVSGGFQTAGDIYDVTAYWALNGGAVHTFAKALDINLGGAPANALPSTLVSGSWRVLARVPSGQTLPAGWQDGYYKAGSDVHVLTKHLSSFALLKDVQAPSKARNFSGSKVHRHLVLKWKAATDNSGVIAAYLVYAKGVLVKTLPGSARTANMSKYKTSDTRSFQVAARDAAGNVGAKSLALVLVPNVKNLTLSQAKARITARGLKSGSVRYTYSTGIPSGRVIGTGRSGLVPKGTAVSLKVSRGVFRSVSSPLPPETSGFGGTPSSPPSTSPSGSPTSGTPSPSGTEGSPPPAPDETPDVAGVQPQSFSPAADESASGLRRLLGLLLVGGAFLAAGAVALRARRGRLAAPAAVAGEEPLLFWDQRLAQALAGSMRRLTNRL